MYGLAIVLVIMSLWISGILSVEYYFGEEFFTPQIYRMLLALLVSGFVMGAISPKNPWRWGLVIGLAPLVHMAILLIPQIISTKSVGNLLPLVLFIMVIFGMVPSFAGAYSGMLVSIIVRKFKK